MLGIVTEWIYCPDCGEPVRRHSSGVLTEVNGDFTPTDVEHECN